MLNAAQPKDTSDLLRRCSSAHSRKLFVLWHSPGYPRVQGQLYRLSASKLAGVSYVQDLGQGLATLLAEAGDYMAF